MDACERTQRPECTIIVSGECVASNRRVLNTFRKHVRWLLVPGIGLIAVGGILTPFPSVSSLSPIPLIAGIVLFSAGLLLLAFASGRLVYLGLAVSAISAGIISLIPNRPRGVLLLPAAALAIMLVLGWKDLSRR